VDNPSAPAGKAHKYARVERERRWLLAAPPDLSAAVAETEIEDVYFKGTRLRLRRMTDKRGASPPIYKLAQKIPSPGPAGLITNTYLSAEEHDVLAQLKGDRIHKVRYSVPPLGIDVFLGELHGLVLAEAEFDSDDAIADFPAPKGAVAEVTGDQRFTGGHLAVTAKAELAEQLAEFGIALLG
jgi:hypothetical protein